MDDKRNSSDKCSDERSLTCAVHEGRLKVIDDKKIPPPGEPHSESEKQSAQSIFSSLINVRPSPRTVMKFKQPSTLRALRKKATAQLRRKPEQRSPAVRERSRLLQELKVQQVELLLQNEELRASHEELLESRARYSQVYDFAPFGYFTLDLGGLILEANLKGAELLGCERSLMRNRPFSSFISYVYRSTFDDFLLSILDSDVTQECELEVIRRRDRVFAHLTGVLLTTPPPAQVLIAMSDMTRRWRAEQALERARQDLEMRVLERTEQLNELNHVLQQKV